MKDMLFEQLADLEIFERLLRFDPARQKLFLCLATLISRGKPLAAQLKATYTESYRQQPAETPIKATATATTSISNTSFKTKTASKLAKLAKAKLVLNCKSHPNDEQTSSTSTSSQTSNSNSTTSANTLDELALQEADLIGLSDCAAANGGWFPFTLESIDFGLRLGSFLSEAGWLSESIGILTFVATKLKRMTLNEQHKIIYLDCLQRSVENTVQQHLKAAFNAPQFFKPLLDFYIRRRA